MLNILYKEVKYKLENLILDIESGKLGLPDLQRPFVWPDTKSRNLLDSMMKGYPIGYFLLWDSNPEAEEKASSIGLTKHTYDIPKQLIIDGQQRLTSLYSIMRGIPVKNKNYKPHPIKIAFSPLQRRFEVSTVAFERSPEWIANLSDVFLNASDSYNYINRYITELDAAREKEGSSLSSQEKQIISDNMADLYKLRDYSVPALDISERADEEAVAEIFVRVNSGGINLKEDDFIMTLISVYNDELRKQIEQFCKDATIPVSSGTSYNQIIEPTPSHIIRVVMGYGFRRSRLRYAYMLLRGKDFDRNVFDNQLRDKRFGELKEHLSMVLNLENWHDFIKCILSAGFISPQLISSKIAIVYCYVLFLIGRKDFGMDIDSLRNIIAAWFFAASTTSYYSSSSETTMETDLSNLRSLKSKSDFIDYFKNKIHSIFTDDYFSITLPNDLITPTWTSPVWSSYSASLNLLDVKCLLSDLHVRVLLSPGMGGKKSAVEKHHLFPKAYLKSIGIIDKREINQIANLAYLEWRKNDAILDEAPAKYWPVVTKNIETTELSRMKYFHALPDNWENMNYDDFLSERRKLIAQIIKAGYETIIKRLS
jgi:hypothetical protein